MRLTPRFLLACAVLWAIACTAPTGDDAPGTIGKADLDAIAMAAWPVEGVVMEVSEFGYRCPCHPDFVLRAGVAPEVAAGLVDGEALRAVLFTDTGQQTAVTLRFGTDGYDSGLVQVAAWDAPDQPMWSDLYLSIEGDVGGHAVSALYTFGRAETGERVPGTPLSPGSVTAMDGASVFVGLEVERAGAPDFDAKLARLRLSPVVEGETGPGDSVSIYFWVRAVAASEGEWIDFGTATIGYDERRERLTEAFVFSQGPGEPDPTAPMLVRVTVVDFNGKAVGETYELEMLDGYPVAGSVVLIE